MFFVNRQKKLENQLAEYREQVIESLNNFSVSFEQYCHDSNRAILQENYSILHKAESLADDIRREIEYTMYTRSLFPESRGDILGLLETTDRIPNQAQNAVCMVLHQYITIPAGLSPDILKLVAISKHCAEIAVRATGKLFTDYNAATSDIGKVDELESQADRVFMHVTEQIFSGSLDGVHKLLLRDMVKSIEEVSDRAENVADRVRIMVAKRTI